MPISDLPEPWQYGVMGVGWVLFVLMMVGWITGKLFVSTREAMTYLRRAEKAEESRDRLIGVVAEQTAIGKLQKAMVDAAVKTRRAEAGDDT